MTSRKAMGFPMAHGLTVAVTKEMIPADCGGDRPSALEAEGFPCPSSRLGAR